MRPESFRRILQQCRFQLIVNSLRKELIRRSAILELCPGTCLSFQTNCSKSQDYLNLWTVDLERKVPQEVINGTDLFRRPETSSLRCVTFQNSQPMCESFLDNRSLLNSFLPTQILHPPPNARTIPALLRFAEQKLPFKFYSLWLKSISSAPRKFGET
eukprot:CAMPEP_0182441586 /NCGR_PEP_ID=MMETSP1172-20130603/552_1 /TAXON_ID=708627 /ORGANISM="Timspurckia oligopyrenoides, Strain CCMP3278" /LENGTH=157 /DNA_ID=CAMNT_0024635955 /DNA_START=451 /DNA_END=924 /DNA_ORIENTATION=-